MLDIQNASTSLSPLQSLLIQWMSTLTTDKDMEKKLTRILRSLEQFGITDMLSVKQPKNWRSSIRIYP